MTNEEKQWVKTLKSHLKKMPKSIELLVSAYGMIAVLPVGTINSYAQHPKGMDLIADENALVEFKADRVMGENSTI